jgi:hypothetical protein
LDVLHEHVVAALAFFFIKQLFAIIDDSVRRLSDESSPQKLHKRVFKKCSSLSLTVLAKDVETTQPLV